MNKIEKITEEITEIEFRIKELEDQKRKLIEKNRLTEKLVSINLKFVTTIKNSSVLKGNIRSAIYKGFDLMGICPPSEVEFKNIKIEE